MEGKPRTYTRRGAKLMAMSPLLPELLLRREKVLARGGTPATERVMALITPDWQKTSVLAEAFVDLARGEKGPKFVGGYRTEFYRVLYRLRCLNLVETASDGRALWARCRRGAGEGERASN